MRMWRFLPLIFFAACSHADRCAPPFFRALDALAVDDRGGRAGLSLGQLPTADVRRVMDAIQQALQRDRVTREQQAAVHKLQGRYQTLTAREREVFGFVVSGLLNKQIASEIGASEATVKIHRGNLMEKMQARSLIELVRMADKLKLVLPK